MERDESASPVRTLHRLTSYIPERPWDVPLDDPRVRQDVVSCDPRRRTPAVKTYAADLPRTALPRELPVGRAAALAVLAGVAPTGSAAGANKTSMMDLAGLSRVLFLSAGVVRTVERDYGIQLYRAAGSAGNRFPLEIYVAIPELADSDLPAGVHWYDAVEHALVRVGPPPAEPDGAPTLVVTGVPWRTGWRYHERGFRHIYWDAGTMLSQVLTLADSADLAPRLFSDFPDAGVSELVGADGIHEWPLAVVSLGDGVPSVTATGAAVAGLTDAAAVEFPLITAAQHAGDTGRLGEPWDFGAATPAALATPEAAKSPTLDEVISKRGSQRRMDPSRGLPLETLRTCMTVAMRGIAVPHWIAVHDVTGLPSGLYRWPDLDQPIRSQSPEEMRAELYRVCLDQALGRDAAFVVIAATDITKLSEREYRDAQLAAGLVEGRLHLSAYALGAGATGMTFLDSEIPALLGDPEAPDGLIFTCVGVPGNTSKPGGVPGAPRPMRPVQPRD